MAAARQGAGGGEKLHQLGLPPVNSATRALIVSDSSPAASDAPCKFEFSASHIVGPSEAPGGLLAEDPGGQPLAHIKRGRPHTASIALDFIHPSTIQSTLFTAPLATAAPTRRDIPS